MAVSLKTANQLIKGGDIDYQSTTLKEAAQTIWVNVWRELVNMRILLAGENMDMWKANVD